MDGGTLLNDPGGVQMRRTDARRSLCATACTTKPVWSSLGAWSHPVSAMILALQVGTAQLLTNNKLISTTSSSALVAIGAPAFLRPAGQAGWCQTSHVQKEHGDWRRMGFLL